MDVTPRSPVTRAARVLIVLPLLLSLLIVPALPSSPLTGVSADPVEAAITVPLFPPAPTPSTLPIQHVIVIMQENHPYDNFFGTYCRQVGPYCPTVGNGLPAGLCVPF